MSPLILAVIVGIVVCPLGFLGGFIYRKNSIENRIGRSEEYAKNLLEDAKRKADDKKKETIMKIK